MKSNPHGKIDIVMVTWHRPEITERTIRAIHQNTKPENYRLIVIDNASPESMRDNLKTLHDNGYIDQLIFNSTNRGLEPARNQGLAEVLNPIYFICADNDCLPQKIDDKGFDWIDHLVWLMDRNQAYGAISCRTQVMVGSGDPFVEADEKGDDLLEFPHPGGSLRIMITWTVREIGGWREDSLGRGAEERYICGRLHDRNLKTAFAVKVKTYHQFGLQADEGEKSSDRWGYNKDWLPEDTGHSDIDHPAFRGDDPAEMRLYYDPTEEL